MIKREELRDINYLSLDEKKAIRASMKVQQLLPERTWINIQLYKIVSCIKEKENIETC